MSETVRNWAGNVTFNAAAVERPASLADLQAVVRCAQKLRVLGSGHSFNRIADTDGTLISLAHLPRRIEIDRIAHTVTVDGGATYAHMVSVLHEAGYALGNVASLPHITVVGAVCTATHGSGDSNRNLAAAVSAIALVTADGEIVRYRRGEADFEGAVVNLGALGVVVELTLELRPSFEIRQNVYRNLPIRTLLDNFDALMASAYSVSLFTRWQGDAIDQVWVKALSDDATPPDTMHGASAAEGPVHPIPDMDGADCTVQMGVAGPWHERLFHFPVGHKASKGEELQSEYFVAREHAADAIRALHAVQEQFAAPILISEIRSVAADDLWLSTAYGRNTIGFHFTWQLDPDAVTAATRVLEAALAPFDPRPHWGKVFTMAPTDVQARYPKLGAFRDLAQRLDPEGKFRNRYVTDLLF